MMLMKDDGAGVWGHSETWEELKCSRWCSQWVWFFCMMTNETTFRGDGSLDSAQ
jgi:hypothetical protein